MAEVAPTVALSRARTALCAVVSLLDVADPCEVVNVGELHALLAPLAERIDDLVCDVNAEVSRLGMALADASARAQASPQA